MLPSESMSFMGVVNLFALTLSLDREVGRLPRTRPIGNHDRARDFLPDLESLGHLLAILEGGEPVASRAEVLGDGTIGGEESLGVTRCLKPLHAPLPLACRLVRILGAVVEIAMLAMSRFAAP